MKNRTRFKSLNVVNNDPRVDYVYQDSDGIWLELNYGFKSAGDDPVTRRPDRNGRCLCGLLIRLHFTKHNHKLSCDEARELHPRAHVKKNSFRRMLEASK